MIALCTRAYRAIGRAVQGCQLKAADRSQWGSLCETLEARQLLSSTIRVEQVGQWGEDDTLASAYDVSVVGNYAYVANGGGGLQVINISNPAAPTLVGGYDTAGYARGVSVAGGYAYVADEGKGLQVLNISNPAAPTLVGGYDTVGSAYALSVVGSYAYVADGGGGLQVFDISDPAAPARVSQYVGIVEDVSVVGNYAYVADYQGVLQVINISNPATPTRVGGYDTVGYVFGVSVVGNYAYVADGGGGLQVLNISDPAAPTWVGGYDTAGCARGVSVAGNYAYVADDDKGLQVINISNPAAPTLEGGYDTAGWAYGVSVVGNYAYVADGANGLVVLRTASNQAPTAIADSVTLKEDTPTTLSPLANDTDPDAGDTLGVVSITQPTHGVAVLNSNGTIRYTPAWGYRGSDSLTYTIRDIAGLTSMGTISLTVTPVTVSAPALKITGTSGADTISLSFVGGKFRVTKNGKSTDYTLASVGAITVDTLAGNDKVTVGTGVKAVTLYGGDGNDSLIGGAGNDYIDGGNGNDTIRGGAGNDRLFGQAGNDYLYGDSGNDTLYGGIGNDTLTGSTGTDYLYGDSGDDTLLAMDDTSDYLIGGAGRDTAYWDPTKDSRKDTIESLETYYPQVKSTRPYYGYYKDKDGSTGKITLTITYQSGGTIRATFAYTGSNGVLAMSGTITSAGAFTLSAPDHGVYFRGTYSRTLLKFTGTYLAEDTYDDTGTFWAQR